MIQRAIIVVGHGPLFVILLPEKTLVGSQLGVRDDVDASLMRVDEGKETAIFTDPYDLNELSKVVKRYTLRWAF